jgi:hypothetical protein
VDGFFEIVSCASVHLHKSKMVVVPWVDNRWQHALRHTIWRSHLQHRISQLQNLMTCNPQVGQLEVRITKRHTAILPLKHHVIYMYKQLAQTRVSKHVTLK